jgi:CheY-like chemotaxis protein
MGRAAGRGAALTQQLLTFARQQPLKQDVHDLNEVIVSFETVLRRAVSSSIGFDIEMAAGLPRVLVDAPQVEAAILNLVVNARDATPDGGAIVLRTAAVDLAEGEVGRLPAGRFVCVSVRDTGAGMSAEVAARAVEPFFTTKPVGKGTGLGLSQVYGLVQQSGGDVHIVSTAGGGTTVSLYFPALQQEADCAPRQDVKEKALLVDDQQDVLEMAVELFRSLGYETLSANNGAEALAILQRTPGVSILFSDVVMPGMSGIELARSARVLYPDLRIILASGYATAALKADNADLDDYTILTKPYTVAQILRQLR